MTGVPYMKARYTFLAVVIAITVALTGVILWTQGSQDDHEERETIATIYRKMAAGLSRPDSIARMTAVTEGTESGWEQDLWLDVPTNRAQLEVRTPYGEQLLISRNVYRDGAQYIVRENQIAKGPAQACDDVENSVLTLFRQCSFDRDKVDVKTHHNASFDGVGAIAIQSKGFVQGIDSVVTIDDWLYLDRDTYVPLGARHDSTDSLHGGNQHRVMVTRYSLQFVSRSDAPTGLFDPKSIGYEAPDLASKFITESVGTPAYWLGDSVPANGTLLGLALDDVFVLQAESRIRAQPWAYLRYRRSDLEFHEASIGLSQVA